MSRSPPPHTGSRGGARSRSRTSAQQKVLRKALAEIRRRRQIQALAEIRRNLRTRERGDVEQTVQAKVEDVVKEGARQEVRGNAPRPVPDVCLFLEGTYPYVAGGVSSWVHLLISNLPNLTFGIVHLGAWPGCYDQPRYQVPDNVLWLDEVYLQIPLGERRSSLRDRIPRRPVPPPVAEAFARFARGLQKGVTEPFAELVRILQSGDRYGAYFVRDLALSPASWDALLGCYREDAEDESFLTYFWTWLFSHEPLLTALTAPLPEARSYHTVSTGYAGVLAAAASRHWHRPMILTEHGIYAKERRIEIRSAEWVVDRMGDAVVPGREPPFFRRFWSRLFGSMSRICYDQADSIYTLYQGNVEEQVRDGADRSKTHVIPNGIDIAGMAKAREIFALRNFSGAEPFTVGFVGRVCPIKDVHTFLAAMRLVADKVPELVVRVLGPMDEDRDYAEDCKRFASQLRMDGHVRFEGSVDLRTEMGKLDVVVLTSISEAQPLVVLEAGAVGVPVVTTDVGCCNELVDGVDAEDRRMGPGGIVTAIASPGATARAVLEMHTNPELRRTFGRNLKARVENYYSRDRMLASYGAIYERLLAPSSADATEVETG